MRIAMLAQTMFCAVLISKVVYSGDVLTQSVPFAELTIYSAGTQEVTYSDLTGIPYHHAVSTAKKLESLLTLRECEKWGRTSVSPCEPIRLASLQEAKLMAVLADLDQRLVDLAVISKAYEEWSKRCAVRVENIIDGRAFDAYVRRKAMAFQQMENGMFQIVAEGKKPEHVYAASGTLREIFDLRSWLDYVRQQENEGLPISLALKARAFPEFDEKLDRPAPWFRMQEECLIFKELIYCHARANAEELARSLDMTWGRVTYFDIRGCTPAEFDELELLFGDICDEEGRVARGGLDVYMRTLRRLGSDLSIRVDCRPRRSIAKDFGVSEAALSAMEFVEIGRGAGETNHYVYVAQAVPERAFEGGVGYDIAENGFLRDQVLLTTLQQQVPNVVSNMVFGKGLSPSASRMLSGYLLAAPTKVIGSTQIPSFLKGDQRRE